jgi:ABC-type transport system involved in cytochrome c biogenesis permease subunit
MIESSIFWLRVAACFYALGLLHSILVVVRHRQNLSRLALATFRIAAVLHGVAITDLALASGRIPVGNIHQTLSLCAFLVAIVFLLVEWRYRFASTSVALFPLVFLMTLVAAMEQPVVSWPDARVRGAWLVVHITLVLAGYAALLLTAVAAVAYLVQERRLKTKQASTLLERLPPLATIDNLISSSLGLAFAFITLGVVFGILWAFIESGTSWIGEPRITLSLFTWALLLVMMFLRASAGWRGRKAALMALAVLSCSAATWVAHAGLGTR